MSRKRIVIIGGGVAGQTVSKGLGKGNADLEIILVEPREYFEVPFAELRALTDPAGFGKTIRKSYKEMLPGVKIIHDKAIAIEKNSVSLAGGPTVPFDYLVLATGSSSRNWPFLKGSETGITERQKAFENEGAKLKTAGSIMIVGGGPIGVELAGEISSKWPEKELHLVQGADRLLDKLSEKMSVRSQKSLETMGVKVTTGIRLSQEGKDWKDQNGKSYKADLVIQAVGIDLNTEWNSGAVNIPKSDIGAIKVGPDLRVEGSSNIFALGDINDVPETKLGAFAGMQAKLTVKNLLKLAKDQTASLKVYKPHSPVGMVTIGREKGAVQLPFGHPHFMIALKQKDMFVGATLK